MPRKAKEDELDLNVQELPKRETFVTRWFNDNCSNNRSEIRTICELTSRSAEEQFGMSVKSSNVEVYSVIFFATFMSILDFIREKQKRYNNYTIEIANSVNLGYTNNDSDDNEKVGNFQPLMEYIGSNRNIINSSQMEVDTTTKNFILWKELNVKKNIEHYKEIQELAYNKLLQEFRTDIRTSEGIIPLFCIFMDNTIGLLKMKYREAEGTGVSEVSFNVLGLFDVFYSFNEDDNQEIIEFDPNITMKLALKSDSIAAR
jgi:hypothetical protein